MTGLSPQRVKHHFQATAATWRDLYRRKDLYARMYQQRRDLVLKFIDGLDFPFRASVLDVGCGPGVTAVELARRGYSVNALDVAPAMVDLTRALALESGSSIRTLIGSISCLPFSNDRFQIVLAVGVAEWVASLETAIAELVRVVAPGGYVIVTMDNRWALHRLLDPALHPALDPLKRLVRRNELKPRPRVHSIRRFNRALNKSGLRVIKSATLGFGPFSILRCPLFSDPLGIRVHQRLQRAADRGTPLVRAAGHVYVAVARKDP